ncbi:hypothetical protein D9758_002579 [Tetrapyrgos nigripes]|uniref:Uncharacterized protein n=1 Tax=Tetrapyrgos nigripes TaxID=182062 RepID=A0A8H5GQU8_9AGAR|nr:hypothetical protein D9758_002579 [Tetrapyrgos nigripes]
MAIMEGVDDLTQLWGLIQDLSEQLNQNRSLSVSLYTQAGGVKFYLFCSVLCWTVAGVLTAVYSQATHSQTGFVLRRFNLDKTKEEYESELDRMNNAMATENRELQHDNKQINALIKEYEQTLDTLMSSFRNRAKDVQERELSLVREYETKLLEMEERNATRELAASTTLSESLSKMSQLLRQCLRGQGGEQLRDLEESRRRRKHNASESQSQSQAEGEGQAEKEDALEELEEFVHEREPWTASDVTQAEWALEREIELARLERENEELRRLVGLSPAGQSF